jgi:hypothetical protein
MAITMSNNSVRVARKALGSILGISLLFSLIACANIGRDFDTSKVYDIAIGKTTQADILAMFGQPWRVGLEDGIVRWTYGSYHYSVFSEARTKDLVVRFDSKNIVTSYSFNTTDATEIKMPHGSRQE